MPDALSEPDLAAIRRWVGPLDQVEDVGGRFERLVLPVAVALEILMERAGELAMTDSQVKQGDESSTRGKFDGEWLHSQIAKAVAYLTTSGDSLNTAATDLVAEAASVDGDEVVRSFPSTVTSLRPG